MEQAHSHMQEYAFPTQTYSGIYEFSFLNSYPLHLICIIQIKSSRQSSQSLCEVESRRKYILLYVNQLHYDIVYPDKERRI